MFLMDMFPMEKLLMERFQTERVARGEFLVDRFFVNALPANKSLWIGSL
jgi:hypothetical protein